MKLIIPSLKMYDVRIAAIKLAITLCDGNKTQSAKMLGISVRALGDWVRFSPELSKYHHPQRYPRKAKLEKK